jgi:hypothetical protein
MFKANKVKPSGEPEGTRDSSKSKQNAPQELSDVILSIPFLQSYDPVEVANHGIAVLKLAQEQGKVKGEKLIEDLNSFATEWKGLLGLPYLKVDPCTIIMDQVMRNIGGIINEVRQAALKQPEVPHKASLLSILSDAQVTACGLR